MPTQDTKNLEVIQEYFTEYWGKGNPDIVDKLCADNFVINYPIHGPRYGKENAKKMLSEFKEARRSIQNSQRFGALEKGNTGKRMYFSGTTIFTLKDGLIVDETGEEAALTALQQLGLVQQPNPGREVKYLHE
ncbi:hypothetical protein FNAPI_11675 [Fusarium napiforme]|uniref:SnoaL-like domain-containing protein n=1 Tax=Fusarium napiforme TaxID=42672 RepID=A0A8H5IG76_9HYPO|nr:hypothetical protein FNAPI_11675 [Fusarium napiforme]